MAISIRDFEAFLLSNQGVLLFHGSILLIALVAAFLLVLKKPRREWGRGLFLTLGIIFLQGIGLVIDLLGSAWNNLSLSALLANIDRSLEMLSITGVVWFFLFPRRHKTGDALSVAWMVVVLLAAAGTSVSLYLYPATSTYNSNLLSFSWDLTRWIY
ncbi:MAG: hypothetical protein WBM17_16910, partial [Anaerolineales bacterium]